MRQASGEGEPPSKNEISKNEISDDWLSRLGGEQVPPPAPEPPAAMPDWLKNIAETAPEAPASPASPPPFTANPISTAPLQLEDEEPDWMKSLVPLYPAAPMPEPKAEPPASAAPPPPVVQPASPEFADFLKKASQPDTAPFPAADFPIPLPPEPQPDAAEPEDLPGWSTGPTPDWLAALEAKAGSPPALNLGLAGARPSEPAPSADSFGANALPDWLSELGTAQRGPESPAPAEVEGQDWIESAQLPNWVQALRPVETIAPRPPAEPPAATDGHVEDRGPLAGLRGILPSEPTIPTFTRKAPVVSTHLEVSELQLNRSQVLESLLATEAQAEDLSGASAISSQHILRLVIAGVLIVALLIPLLSGVRVFPDPTSAPQEVLEARNSLAALPDGAPVLVVADYSPAVSGEMQAAASAALTDLMKKGAQLVVISSTPTGSALADQLLASLTASDASLQAYGSGEKITRLGYLPGGITALADFAANPQTAAPNTLQSGSAWQQPALQEVHAIGDFARVVVLTADANTGQAWIEQVQPKLGAQSEMLVIAGAQAAPVLRPYFYSRQISGLIAGVAGGAAYEVLVGRKGTGWFYWDAFQFGTWAAVLIILVGVLAGSVSPVLAAIQGKGEVRDERG
jgi:hypothetical protein